MKPEEYASFLVKGRAFILPGVGIVLLERVCPSGSWVVVDCHGKQWLVTRSQASDMLKGAINAP